MKITYSQMHAEYRSAIEVDFTHAVEKLERLCTHHSPDLVHLHASIERNSHTDELSLSLNLRIPTAEFHATGKGADPRAATKIAFAEIEAQVKKHQQKLRKDYVWKRKRDRGPVKAADGTLDLQSTD